jgi:hypothetical protein
MIDRRQSLVPTGVLIAGLVASALTAGCGDDDGTTNPPPEGIQLALQGFPAPSPPEGHYELWISFVDAARHDNATTVGKFRVAANGAIVDLAGAPVSFQAPADAIWAYAIDTFITIEPDGDADSTPAGAGFIGGDIISREAALTTSGADALDTSFSSAAGSCVLATPTSSDSTDALAGVWFTNAGGTSAALTLPDLPTGWIYEGWISRSVEGVATLGRFEATDAPDSDLSGPLRDAGGRVDNPGGAYSFPGSDFPYEEPPIDLVPGTVFVTIEPAIDQDGSGPFFLRVLEGSLGIGGGPGGATLANRASTLPTASLSIPRQ